MSDSAFARKLFFTRIFILVIVGLYLFRLFDLQVVRGEEYHHIAQENRQFQRSIPAERGVILDRYGEPLTLNAKQYYLVDDSLAIYRNRKQVDREEALAWLATDSARIEFDHYRVYAWGRILSHVLGYVGAVTADELRLDRQLKASDRIGKTGLEKYLQSKLRGVDGVDQFEINAPGERQRSLVQVAPQAGTNVETTLDPYLSSAAAFALGDQIGAVIINDLQTGQILTMISQPDFDPNLFTQPAANDQAGRVDSQINQWFSDVSKPLFNRAVSGTYPPGSIFKLATALAGLENQVLDAQTSVLDEGVLQVGEYAYANWYFTQYGRTEGTIQLVKALARSNDIFFYKVAEWVGPDRLAEMAKLLGMGRLTGIEIGSEVTGLIPEPSWKETNFGERWYLGNTYHMGIGQGDVLVTPIQVAEYLQAVLSGDHICQPSLLKNAISQCENLSLASQNVELVKQGMIAACSAGGTAFPFFDYNTKLAEALDQNLDSAQAYLDRGMVACKTGTAEFGGVGADGYKKTHAWFVMGFGFHPDMISDQYTFGQELLVEESQLYKLHSKWSSLINQDNFPTRLGIVVLVESTDDALYKEGSSDAAPVARKIVDWMLTGSF